MPSRPFIPVPNTASVELIYQQIGEVSENVFKCYKGTPFSLSDLQALRGVVNTWDSATASAVRTSSASLFRIRTKALDSLGSPMEDYYLPTPRPGTIVGTNAPLNMAFCVKLGTGHSGRSYRGRWYWGNLTMNQTSDAGHMAVVSANLAVAALNTLVANLAAAGYTMCVTSYMTGGVWRASGLNTAITTAVATDTLLDSMRRRLPGRGHTL